MVEKMSKQHETEKFVRVEISKSKYANEFNEIKQNEDDLYSTVNIQCMSSFECNLSDLTSAEKDFAR